MSRELPQLDREFNGIDFGHAHIAETLLQTQDAAQVEQARLEVLDFIFSAPRVPPDEEQVAPTATKLAWEAQKLFNWSHALHRSLWDLFASDKVKDKENAYRKILADYLDKPEAVTPHYLDHHEKLWSFPESKAFRNKFRKFNTQIWAYHWLQAAAYDVQLMGNAARQRELMPKIIEHYHGYLRQPPTEWEFMPMFHEGAPEFAGRFPEVAAIFDNMHMLHDNVDDILSSPDLYPTLQAKREAILRVLPIYLHRNHTPDDRFVQYHSSAAAADHQHGQPPSSHQQPPAKHEKNLDADLKDHPPKPGAQQTGQKPHSGNQQKPADSDHADHEKAQPGAPAAMARSHQMTGMGPRPPSAREVLEGKVPPRSKPHSENTGSHESHQHKR